MNQLMTQKQDVMKRRKALTESILQEITNLSTRLQKSLKEATQRVMRVEDILNQRKHHKLKDELNALEERIVAQKTHLDRIQTGSNLSTRDDMHKEIQSTKERLQALNQMKDQYKTQLAQLLREKKQSELKYRDLRRTVRQETDSYEKARTKGQRVSSSSMERSLVNLKSQEKVLERLHRSIQTMLGEIHSLKDEEVHMATSSKERLGRLKRQEKAYNPATKPLEIAIAESERLLKSKQEAFNEATLEFESGGDQVNQVYHILGEVEYTRDTLHKAKERYKEEQRINAYLEMAYDNQAKDLQLKHEQERKWQQEQAAMQADLTKYTKLLRTQCKNCDTRTSKYQQRIQANPSEALVQKLKGVMERMVTQYHEISQSKASVEKALQVCMDDGRPPEECQREYQANQEVIQFAERKLLALMNQHEAIRQDVIHARASIHGIRVH